MGIRGRHERTRRVEYLLGRVPGTPNVHGFSSPGASVCAGFVWARLPTAFISWGKRAAARSGQSHISPSGITNCIFGSNPQTVGRIYFFPRQHTLGLPARWADIWHVAAGPSSGRRALPPTMFILQLYKKNRKSHGHFGDPPFERWYSLGSLESGLRFGFGFLL